MKTVKFYSCKISKGFKRSLVVDVQRKEIYEINQNSYDFLDSLPMNTDGQSVVSNNELDNFLELEVVFKTRFPSRFVEKIDLGLLPQSFTNAILDLGKTNNAVKSSMILFDALNVRHIQIRIFDPINKIRLTNLLQSLCQFSFVSVDIILPKGDEYFLNSLSTILQKFPIVNSVLISGLSELPDYLNNSRFFFTESDLSKKDCGAVASQHFNLGNLHYVESLNHNTCLNGKISIDSEGYVKNCPSMEHFYGSIGKDPMDEILSKIINSDFKLYWNIKKDDIKICRDCEFRHICTDCRAYREDDTDMYSKPLKCGYNPYIAKWNTEGVENGYQTVAESIADGVVSEEYVYRTLDA